MTDHNNVGSGSGVSGGGVSSGGGGGSGTSGLYGFQLTGTVPTIASAGFTTWYNQGTGTIEDDVSGIVLTPQGGNGVTGYGRAKPSTPYTAKALVASSWPITSTTMQAGIGMWDSVSQKLIFVHVYTGNNNFLIQAWNNPNSYASDLITPAANIGYFPKWLSIGDDGTNLTFGFSNDGHNYANFLSIARASTILSGGYTHIGMMMYPPSGVSKETLMDWVVG